MKRLNTITLDGEIIFFFRATNELDFPKMNRQDKWIKCDRIAWRFNDIEANVKV